MLPATSLTRVLPPRIQCLTRVFISPLLSLLPPVLPFGSVPPTPHHCAATLGIWQPLKPPLLVERHNARPGMVLFYSAQGLVFAKLGSTVRDKDKEFGMALKQAETNLRAAKFLPGDFKLTAAA